MFWQDGTKYEGNF